MRSSRTSWHVRSTHFPDVGLQCETCWWNAALRSKLSQYLSLSLFLSLSLRLQEDLVDSSGLVAVFEATLMTN